MNKYRAIGSLNLFIGTTIILYLTLSFIGGVVIKLFFEYSGVRWTIWKPLSLTDPQNYIIFGLFALLGFGNLIFGVRLVSNYPNKKGYLKYALLLISVPLIVFVSAYLPFIRGRHEGKTCGGWVPNGSVSCPEGYKCWCPACPVDGTGHCVPEERCKPEDPCFY